jgi:hypothetical protein
MKRLNFKKLKLLYVNLLTIVIVLPSFGAFGGGLHAQDPQLFENTWYLEKVSVDNLEYLLADYYTAEITVTEFNEENSTLYSSLCEFVCFWFNIVFDSEENIMDLSDYDECVLTGECTGTSSELYLFKEIYFSVFYYWDTVNQNGVYNNPFNYVIEPIDNYMQLTVSNGEGDWAVYNSILLSTSTFNQNSFNLYPNPVAETLFINNTFNQQVQAKMYDVSGKLLQSYLVETGQSQIDANLLQSGLYFVVFESEYGDTATRKFIKK